MRAPDENFFCHIIIPSKNYQRSKKFFEKVFRWRIEEQPGTGFLDMLPLSGKGVSAELNSEVDVVIPAIHTKDIDAKLMLIEEFGGKRLKGKTSIDKHAEHGYYSLFEDPEGNRMCLYSKG